MEISFINLSYMQNSGLKNERVLLNNISYKFDSNSITMISGEVDSLIGKLIVANKRPSKGTIKVNNILIKKSNSINVDEIRKNVAFVGHTINKNVKRKYVYDELKYYYEKYCKKQDSREKRISEALKIVGLDDNYIYRAVEELSYTERKRVNLAAMLVYNPKVLIFDNYELGFSDREKKNIKKLILNLKNKYKKDIIIISNDIEFGMNFVDKILVINKGEIVYQGDNSSFYDDKLYEFVSIPKIVEFIKYVNSLGKYILTYYDNKELLKAIYRSVG